MSLYGAIDKTKHFSEFLDPLFTPSGVTSSADRIAACLANLGITATGAEINLTDGALVGLTVASKAVIANTDGSITNTGGHLSLAPRLSAADMAGKTVKISSVTNTGTANDFIGFQAKPAQGASTAQSLKGCEISPRINDTFALTGTGTIIGAHIDTYLKGTTGDIGGDVRALNLELVTDDAGTRTVSGGVVAVRVRAAWSGTITGDMVVFRVEKAETQTNSKQWEYLFELTGDNGLVWKDDYTNEAGTQAGAIKVRVNGQDRWIALYSSAPVV